MLIDALEIVDCYRCGFNGKLAECTLILTNRVRYSCPKCGEILKVFIPKRKRQPKYLFDFSIGELSITEAADIYNMNVSTLHNRLRLNMDAEEAVKKPVNHKFNWRRK